MAAFAGSRAPSSRQNDFSVQDLANQLHLHSLDGIGNDEELDCVASLVDFRDSWSKLNLNAPRQARPPSPPYEDLDEACFCDEQPRVTGLLTPGPSRPSSSHSADSHPSPTYSTASNTAIRRQRQRAVRMQCSASHLEQVRSLVARMIDRGELCSVQPLSPVTEAVSPASSNDGDLDLDQNYQEEPAASLFSSWGFEALHRSSSGESMNSNSSPRNRIGKSTKPKRRRCRRDAPM